MTWEGGLGEINVRQLLHYLRLGFRNSSYPAASFCILQLLDKLDRFFNLLKRDQELLMQRRPSISHDPVDSFIYIYYQ
jgi:hypothetical protein